MSRIWINVIMADLIKIFILVVVIPCFVIYLLKGLKHWKFWRSLCEKTDYNANWLLGMLLYLFFVCLTLWLLVIEWFVSEPYFPH